MNSILFLIPDQFKEELSHKNGLLCPACGHYDVLTIYGSSWRCCDFEIVKGLYNRIWVWCYLFGEPQWSYCLQTGALRLKDLEREDIPNINLSFKNWTKALEKVELLKFYE